ncbi:MAG: hypothetical protein ACRD8Z_20365 [Nitrososphaeraceae archaeon]
MRYRLNSNSIIPTADVQQLQQQGRGLENILIMQGGGSLGAFACGVYKALVK